MRAIQKAITECVESDEPEDFDFKAFKQAMLAKQKDTCVD